APAAQEVADALVKAGVRGLLNLSPAHVLVPENVAVVDTRIVESLQELAHRLVIER
ncbi:MAG: redox-sensing transcriptional repressor Rex, partial [Lentisphaerae bacterium]|nr:redox-sensing transcriptional repressor Rex [Lentisphaerota bacterium]